ncbi:hypothetical protein AQUCO_05300097v1, partial [Aquilegia coerulea]
MCLTLRNMDYSNNIVANSAILLLLMVGVIYISIWSPYTTDGLSSFKTYQCLLSNRTKMVNPRDGLRAALDEASNNGNKTLIIAMINKAYVQGEKPLLNLFLDSFWLGNNTQALLDQLLLVTLDQIAFNRCKFLRLHCYGLVTDGVDYSGEKLYMSDDFIKMMWRRTNFLANVLKRGYNFIFTDIDVMWLSNPFARLSQNQSVDIQISCDQFVGNEWSSYNRINTGFYFIRSNNKTISLLDTWYAMKNDYNDTKLKEQDVLQQMLDEGVFAELGVSVRYLDTLYFSGFCQDSKDLRAVNTVHANCCRGIYAKVADLMNVLQDWKKFRSVSDHRRKLRRRRRS